MNNMNIQKVSILLATALFLSGCNTPIQRGSEQNGGQVNASSYYPEKCVIESMKVSGVKWDEARIYCECMYDQIMSGNQKETYAAQYCERKVNIIR